MNSNRSQSETPETPEQHNLFHWPLIKPVKKKKEKHSKIEHAWQEEGDFFIW